MTTRRTGGALALLVASIVPGVAPWAEADEPPATTVVIDGKETPVTVTVVEGDGAVPRADDVLGVGVALMRGTATRIRLRTERGKWFQIGEDGSETLVAISATSGELDPKSRLTAEEFLALPDAVLGTLRGIALDGWDEPFAARIRALDAARCAVSVTVGPADLARLPPGVRSLRIRASSESRVDLRPLATQPALLHLAVDDGIVDDWSPLAAVRGLQSLEGPVRPQKVATVPALPSLRWFSAGFDDEVSDVSFVARFPALRELQVWGSGVADLSPIEGLRHVREVHATNSPVAKLPSGAVPSLRKLSILGHRVPPEDLRTFLAANPQCETEHSWRARLDAAVAGADGLRVRTGGLCHRDPDEETTLHESRDPEALRGLLAAIVLDEPASGGLCACCGEPTIEFLRGGETIVSLSLHHEAGFRWGGWPGDARLTPDSADAVCTWLTERGAPCESPRQSQARLVVETRARDAAQEALLGAERAAAARSCKGAEALAAIVRETAPAIDARVRLLLRLTVIDGGTDDSPGATVPRLAEKALRAEDPEIVAAALLAILTNVESPPDLLLAAADAVRDLDDDDSPLPKAALAGLRIPAARAFLTRTESWGRWRAVDVLARAGTPEGAALAMTLLPPPAKEGQSLPELGRADMELVTEIALFCEEKDLPHLRALAVASRDPKGWGERLEREIRRREPRSE